MIRRIPVRHGVLELADEVPDGRPPAVPAIVLLHGFTGSKESWLELREELRKTRRVLSLDLPGHGATQISGDASRFSMESTARSVIEALEALDITRFALVGYSMGGRLALYLALEYGTRVERLALESASAGIADPDERRRRKQADEELAKFLESAPIDAFVKRWESMPLFDSQRELGAGVRESLRRARLSCTPAGLAASLRGIGTGNQPWLGARLGELALPVLIVVGALDSKFMKIGAHLARGIRRASLSVVSGAGHTPHLERPAEFNRALINFIGAKP